MSQHLLKLVEKLNSSLWKNTSILEKNDDNLHQISSTYQFQPPAILIRIVLTIFLRIGFLFVQIGTVPVTNVNFILLQNLLDFSWTTLVYFLIGFIFSYSADSNNGLIGGEHWIGETNINKTEALIDWQTISITSAISTSGVIGRLHTMGSIISSILLSGLVQPLIIHWASAPTGWMIKNKFFKKEVIFKDHSGAAIIHVVGGLGALIGCLTLGRRILKLKDIDKSSIPFSSPAIVFAGYFLIFLGLQGVSSIDIPEKVEQVLLNSLLAASSSSLVVIIFHFLRSGHFSDYWKITRCIQSAISGLVAVSATPDVYSPLLSILFGSVSGIIFYILSEIIFKSALEDNCNIISIHLINGFLGSLLSPLSAYNLKELKSIWIDIMWQGNCLITIMGTVIVIMVPTFLLLKICGCLRNRSEFLNHLQSRLALKNRPIKFSMQRIFSQEKKNTFLKPGCISNLSQMNFNQSFLELAPRNNFLKSQKENCGLIKEEIEIGTDVIDEKNGETTEQVFHLKESRVKKTRNLFTIHSFSAERNLEKNAYSLPGFEAGDSFFNRRLAKEKENLGKTTKEIIKNEALYEIHRTSKLTNLTKIKSKSTLDFLFKGENFRKVTMAEKLSKQLQAEAELFKQVQKDYHKALSKRQKLDGQLNENTTVKEELDLLKESNNVYKLIGPVLVKQDLEEAKENVSKRISYITTELKSTDELISDLDTKQEKHRAALETLQQLFQMAQRKE